MCNAGVIKVEDVRAWVEVEEARVNGDEGAVDGEAAAEEGASFLRAADEREARPGAPGQGPL